MPLTLELAATRSVEHPRCIDTSSITGIADAGQMAEEDHDETNPLSALHDASPVPPNGRGPGIPGLRLAFVEGRNHSQNPRQGDCRGPAGPTSNSERRRPGRCGVKTQIEALGKNRGPEALHGSGVSSKFEEHRAFYREDHLTPHPEPKMNESTISTLLRRWSGLSKKRRTTLPKPAKFSKIPTFREFTAGLFNRSSK